MNKRKHPVTESVFISRSLQSRQLLLNYEFSVSPKRNMKLRLYRLDFCGGCAGNFSVVDNSHFPFPSTEIALPPAGSIDCKGSRDRFCPADDHNEHFADNTAQFTRLLHDTFRQVHVVST